MNIFYMPTKIFSGENAILENYQVLDTLGQKAMIVTGNRSSKVNGSLKDMEEALKKNFINYVIFDEIGENPSLEIIEKAGERGKKEGVDFLIGIGGGSPIDSAKVIGILIKNPNLKGEDIFSKRDLQSVPVAAVPTTSGTGSEVTQYAVVTLHKEKTKKNFGQIIFPAVSFLDPRYTQGLPPQITLNTAIDTFSHLVEGYLNRNAGILTDTLAEAGLKLWGECLDSLLSGNFDFKDREKLMYASTLGGILIAQTGTSLPHGMGYALTYYKGLPHGLANGVLYVEYLRIFKNREKVGRLPGLLGIKDYETFEGVLRKLTQAEVTATDEEIREYASAMTKNEGKLVNHPEKVTYEELYNIYRKSIKKV